MHQKSLLFVMAACALAQAANAADVRKPDEIRYGATLVQMESALRGKCNKMTTRHVDPPFLPNVRDKQFQIDCDGFLYFGKPRWAEFVIRDDALEMVWIMVDDAEQVPIIAAMTASYGPPTHRNADYVAFVEHRTAWRFKPAEVLFYSQALAPEFLADFQSKGGQE